MSTFIEIYTHYMLFYAGVSKAVIEKRRRPKINEIKLVNSV